MRKIFRMAYESCSGQCYAYSDVMRIHTLGLDVRGAAAFLARLLDMHRPSCGNPNLQFRLDADEYTEYDFDYDVEHPRTRFVASFYRYGALDLYGGATAREAMDKLIDGALAWYASDEGREKLGSSPGAGRESVCHHGTDEKLVDFALAFSGLSEDDQRAVRKMVVA